MMRKLTALLCALTLLLTCACALADGTVYELPELDMTLTLPDTVLAITADTSESVFQLLGMDKDTIAAAMKANDTYMLIFPFDWNMEIDLVIADNNTESLEGMDDASMELVGRMIKQLLENEGVAVERYDVYENAAGRYFRHFYSASGDGDTNYAVQYYTIRNHKGIVLRGFSYEGAPLTEEQQALVRQIVDGAAYN